MGGGLMQLVAYGAQDIYLTGQPQITFFKSVYRRHTNFAVESIQQTINGSISAGSRVSVTISRNGDLLKNLWIQYAPNALVTANTTALAADLSHAILGSLEIEIGGQLIDRQYGTWLTVYRDLTEMNPTGAQGELTLNGLEPPPNGGSGIIDVNTRDGNRKEFSGKISINPINAKFHIEAPITKYTDGGGSSSYVISYKTSYLDKTAPILYKNADPVNGLPYSFNDLYGKYSFSGSNGSKANFFGFMFDDNSKFNSLKYYWNNVGFGTNLLIIPDGSSTLINIAAGFSNYGIKLTEANGNPRSSGINSFNASFGFTNYFGKDDLKYGFEVVGFNTLYNYKNSTGRNIDQENSNTEASGYIKLKKIIGSRIVLEPGIRAVYYASLSESSIEPRIGAKYNVNSSFRLKGAAGMYSQNLISAVSDQDVVNLFYGFLSSPDDISRNGSLRNTNSRIQTAWHAVFGFEFDILDNNKSKLSLNSEAFYKNFNQIISINRYKIYENDPSNINRSDLQKFDYIAEKGLSYGADATLKFENKKLNIWAVYSLTYVTRNDGVVGEYMPHFDRRHNINIVVNQSWGNKANPSAWTANLRWNFGSGFPFTQTQGLYEKLNFAGGISSNPLVQNGNLGVYYEQINTGRLPYFHRLDVSLSRKIIISKSSVFNITAAATNVYNRENIFYFDVLNYKRINQLPFLPTLGFSLTF
jgi:hypothetical protein